MSSSSSSSSLVKDLFSSSSSKLLVIENPIPLLLSSLLRSSAKSSILILSYYHSRFWKNLNGPEKSQSEWKVCDMNASDDLASVISTALNEHDIVYVDSISPLFLHTDKSQTAFHTLSKLSSLLSSHESKKKLLMIGFDPRTAMLLPDEGSFGTVSISSTAYLKQLCDTYVTMSFPETSSSVYSGKLSIILKKSSGKIKNENYNYFKTEEGSVTFALDVPQTASSIAAQALASVSETKSSETKKPDPTENLSFNLKLTDEQKESRSKVVLPFMEAQQSTETSTATNGGQGAGEQKGWIDYIPEDEDDIDEEDPDDDLDF